MSVERATTLAFAGRLADAERELGTPKDFEGRWLSAYLHNCTGRFDEALTIAMTLAEESGDAAIASRSLVTAASVLRQLGRHLPAFPLDDGALALAPDDWTRAHAHIGLAADAAGLGRVEECARNIDAAAAVAPRGDWRLRVRLAWVRCEHALSTRRARKAVTHARDAVDRAREAKARRHEAKSLLFLGVALREAGDRAWRAQLRLAEDIARRCGAVPVAEEAARLLPEKKELAAKATVKKAAPKKAPAKRAAPKKSSTAPAKKKPAIQ